MCLDFSSIYQVVKLCYGKDQTNLEKFCTCGSGYALIEVKYLDLNIYEFDPLRGRGGNGKHWLFISEKIHNKHALIDV